MTELAGVDAIATCFSTIPVSCFKSRCSTIPHRSDPGNRPRLRGALQRALGVPIEYLHVTPTARATRPCALAEGSGSPPVPANSSPSSTQIFCPRPISSQPHPALFRSPPAGHGADARWTYLDRDYSALTEGGGHPARRPLLVDSARRAVTQRPSFFNFNGTASVWRRSAIEDAGGWEHDTLTEDTDLSYRAQLRGWEFRYLLDVECPSELPVEMNAFKTQQARWAKGLMQTAKKILPRIMRSDLPGNVKAEAFFHLTSPNVTTSSADGAVFARCCCRP